MKSIFMSIGLMALATTCAPPSQPQAVHGQVTSRWLTLPKPPPLPQPTLSGEAPVNGINLHYSTYGNGPPLIFLHGALGNSENWSNQVPAFSDRYRVILVDSRGHGRSTRDARPYSYDLMADDVVGLMDHCTFQRRASSAGATAASSAWTSPSGIAIA